MRFLIQIIAIALAAFLLEIFLPWYFIAIAAFIMGFVVPSRSNFLAGFLGIAILWTFKAWLIDSASASHLADKVALIFPLKEKYLLFLVMALLGGLVGGFAAMAGSALRPAKKKYY